MSQSLLRSAVPPRDLAATITARSVTRAGWGVAFVYLAIAAIAVTDLWISRSYPPSVAFSLLALAATGTALWAVVRRPTTARGVLFLVVGTVAGFVFDVGLLSADPDLNVSGTYLINRMAVVLLLIGSLGDDIISGFWWCSAGFALGTISVLAAQWSLGLAINPGFGALVVLTIYLVVIAMFALIRRHQRRFTPDFSEVEAETARMAGQREMEERAVAFVHETVLNNLAAIAVAPSEIDSRVGDRLRRDINAVAAAQADPGSLTAVPESSDTNAGDLRDRLLAVMSEYQWRGLSVDVSGGEKLSASVDSGTTSALVNAVSVCLENVLQHSESETAEIFVDATAEKLSVMVVDHGRGFDPACVPDDRLGIRRVLIQHVENCGGAVRVWSAKGAGTSVVISVPIRKVDHD